MTLIILQALLTIVAAILPTILAARAARQPTQARERIDAILTTGTPLDVAAELSGLYDASYDTGPPRQSHADVRPVGAVGRPGPGTL